MLSGESIETRERNPEGHSDWNLVREFLDNAGIKYTELDINKLIEALWRPQILFGINDVYLLILQGIVSSGRKPLEVHLSYEKNRPKAVEAEVYINSGDYKTHSRRMSMGSLSIDSMQLAANGQNLVLSKIKDGRDFITMEVIELTGEGSIIHNTTVSQRALIQS